MTYDTIELEIDICIYIYIYIYGSLSLSKRREKESMYNASVVLRMNKRALTYSFVKFFNIISLVKCY